MSDTDIIECMRIVFAHFGSRIPKFLILNMIRVGLMYEKYPVTLLTDQKPFKFQQPNISITKVQRDNSWVLIEHQLTHPRKFRNNFWFTSLIRFIEIAKFGLDCNEKMLHIESDVVTSSDLPLDKLELINEPLAFPLFNDEMGIASLLLVNKKQGSQLLLDECLAAVKNDSKTTDMLVLGQLARNYPNKVLILPSFIDTRNMLRSQDVDYKNKITLNIPKFGGVFDGLDIGQFIFGEDARNNRGLRILRRMNPYSNLNVLSCEYKFKSNRDFPYLIGHNQFSFPLYSIHIHSKNKRAFKLDNSRYLRKYFYNSRLGRTNEFEPITFLSGLTRFISRRILKLAFGSNDH